MVDGSIDTSHIGALQVTTAKIAADAVTAAKLADDAVVTANIVDANVTSAKMAANSIDSASYVDGSIDNEHIADNAIDSEHYADGSIDNAHIADDAIDSEHYADGSIDTAHIGATQVTGAKLNNDVISAQTALGATPADTDELLVSDAGVLKRVDYSYIKGITAANFRPSAKPLVINGNFGVWQRGTAATTISGGFFLADRFKHEEGTDGTATLERSTNVPASEGFPYSQLMKCTGTDSSLASNQQLYIHYRMEGQDLQHLKWGLADGEYLTVAFWCRSNQTGTHTLALRKLDNTSYNYPIEYTISSADTWEKKVIAFPPLTNSNAGGAIANDNGDGLELVWQLASGSSYQGTADQWTATNQGAVTTSSAVNFMSSTSNEFYITGVQAEIGNFTSATIPPFQHESYGDNLLRCQRYYQLQDALNGARSTSTSVAFIYKFTGEMRAIPSGTVTAALQVSNNVDADYTQATPGVTMYSGRVSTRGALSQATFPTLADPVGRMYNTHPVVSGSIALNAEL